MSLKAGASVKALTNGLYTKLTIRIMKLASYTVWSDPVRCLQLAAPPSLSQHILSQTLNERFCSSASLLPDYYWLIYTIFFVHCGGLLKSLQAGKGTSGFLWLRKMSLPLNKMYYKVSWISMFWWFLIFYDNYALRGCLYSWVYESNVCRA